MNGEKNYAKRKTFYILNKIRELIKFAPEGDLLRYQIKFFNNGNHQKKTSPIKEDEILHDIQRWGALKIENKERLDNETIYYLKILPKFETIYLDHKNLIAKNKEEKIQGYEDKYQPTNDPLSIRLRNCQLKINENTGDVKLNKFKATLNPKSEEFRILIKLATNKDHMATYKDLLGDNTSKVNKRNLSFVIRNLKKDLGILPIKNAKNKDIIKNIKKYGYRIID